MLHELSESEPLRRSPKNRRTQVWFIRFFCLLTFDDMSASQSLLRTDENRWKEVSYIMLLRYVIFKQLTESEPLLRSEQNSWTKVWCKTFLCMWSSISSLSRSISFEVSNRGEQKYRLWGSFAMWFSISWPSRKVCFEVSKTGEQKYLDECSFDICS